MALTWRRASGGSRGAGDGAAAVETILGGGKPSYSPVTALKAYMQSRKEMLQARSLMARPVPKLTSLTPTVAATAAM